MKLKRKTSNLPLGEANFRRLFKTYQRNAKDKNLKFELTEETFRILTKSKCFYCDLEPHKKFDDGKSYGPYIFNGVDRLNNSIGYINLNCVPCCYLCNSFKSNFGFMEFVNHIDKIYKNMNFMRLRNEN